MMKRKLFSTTLSLVLAFAYVSCGGDSDDNDDSSNNEAPQEEQSQEGTFRSVLNVVNPEVFGTSSAASVVNLNDQFTVDIFGSGPATTHAQFIQSGTRCPTASDDTNQDGFIDANEAAEVYGDPILPLDSDLTSNGGVFPFATQYHYHQTANFSQILANLNIPSLLLEGKVMTIQGVPDATELPGTVQGAKRDFPIACGTLMKVSE